MPSRFEKSAAQKPENPVGADPFVAVPNTCAPWERNSSAIARPMPLDVPVTRTRLFITPLMFAPVLNGEVGIRN
jgi:hypothetical protein